MNVYKLYRYFFPKTSTGEKIYLSFLFFSIILPLLFFYYAYNYPNGILGLSLIYYPAPYLIFWLTVNTLLFSFILMMNHYIEKYKHDHNEELGRTEWNLKRTLYLVLVNKQIFKKGIKKGIIFYLILFNIFAFMALISIPNFIYENFFITSKPIFGILLSSTHLYLAFLSISMLAVLIWGFLDFFSGFQDTKLREILYSIILMLPLIFLNGFLYYIIYTGDKIPDVPSLLFNFFINYPLEITGLIIGIIGIYIAYRSLNVKLSKVYNYRMQKNPGYTMFTYDFSNALFRTFFFLLVFILLESYFIFWSFSLIFSFLWVFISFIVIVIASFLVLRPLAKDLSLTLVKNLFNWHKFFEVYHQNYFTTNLNCTGSLIKIHGRCIAVNLNENCREIYSHFKQQFLIENNNFIFSFKVPNKPMYVPYTEPIEIVYLTESSPFWVAIEDEPCSDCRSF